MTSSTITRYVNPWKFKREQNATRMAALRQRDGDTCRRCRRTMRFDLPAGHDLGPKVEAIVAIAPGEEPMLDNLCLCHARCNADAGDDTTEVRQRIRMKSEADLFDRSRRQGVRSA